MKNFVRYFRWAGALFIAFVFVQSLFFKFSGSNETQHIFGILGEWSGFQWFTDYGAYGIGVAELIASIVLLTRYWGVGALMSLGIMSGAIFFHLFTPLGIYMPNFDETGIITGDDGGTLFIMACLTWCLALTLVLIEWRSEDGTLKSISYLLLRQKVSND